MLITINRLKNLVNLSSKKFTVNSLLIEPNSTVYSKTSVRFANTDSLTFLGSDQLYELDLKWKAGPRYYEVCRSRPGLVHGRVFSGNKDIGEQAVHYIKNNKVAHKNLTREDALCFTNNGPQARWKLANLQAYINEARMFKAVDQMQNWRMINTEEGIYDRVFNVLHPFVGPHPKEWRQFGISGELFRNSKSGSVIFMAHHAVWRVDGIWLQTDITGDPMPKGWGKNMDFGLDNNQGEFKICYEASSGSYFIKHSLTDLFYKIHDTSHRIWTIRGQGEFAKLIGTSLGGKVKNFLYTPSFVETWISLILLLLLNR